jgi:hypothetical protein
MKEGKIGKPPLMVIMTVGYNQSLYVLQPVAADLLKERGTTVQEKDRLAYGYFVADTLSHFGERAKIAQYPHGYSFFHVLTPFKTV